MASLTDRGDGARVPWDVFGFGRPLYFSQGGDGLGRVFARLPSASGSAVSSRT